ncbi:MAG: purine-nucleoside phosphorylase [Deltaproteobacteria bacterium]|nr:purine-nucleoside phosphorylase [Deltaproteobacteria bacterium]
MNPSYVLEASHLLNERIGQKASLGIILGSGLGAFVDYLQNKKEIPYSQIPHFPMSSVSGHKGQFVFGKMGNIPVYVLQGRIHYYEGHPLEDVTFPVRVLKQLGATTLIVTNAAGSINRSYKAGELMLIKDHINLLGTNPLRGKNWEEWGPRFPDLTEAYDEALRKKAKAVAKKIKVQLREGIYVAVPGPSYETPAEVKMLKTLGADAVGMSTVPEVIVANHQGMKVCGISCLTNYAAYTGAHKLGHEEVLKVTQNASKKFGLFLKEFIIMIT